MTMKQIKKGCLIPLYSTYLRFLERTMTVKAKGLSCFTGNQIIGFWHEDSFIMNLFLNKLAKDKNVLVLVTADERGDYIEGVLNRNGGKAVRLPDGAGTRAFMKTLVLEAQKEGQSIAAAMDGPLGPRREPKTLVFFLSEAGNKELVTVQAKYSRNITLKRRWDHYAIPLPFTTVTITLKPHGVVKRKNR